MQRKTAGRGSQWTKGSGESRRPIGRLTRHHLGRAVVSGSGGQRQRGEACTRAGTCRTNDTDLSAVQGRRLCAAWWVRMATNSFPGALCAMDSTRESLSLKQSGASGWIIKRRRLDRTKQDCKTRPGTRRSSARCLRCSICAWWAHALWMGPQTGAPKAEGQTPLARLPQQPA
jgi:hypothetical protein